MAISLVLSMLSTFIIALWGLFLLRLISETSKKNHSFFTIYFIGLSILCAFANAASVFTGLDSIWCFPFLLLPAFIKPKILPELYRHFEAAIPKGIELKTLSAIIILLLISMHAWQIKHPDTLTYQNKLIAHALNPGQFSLDLKEEIRLGYGGSWFPLAALFSYHFLLGKIMTFVNLSTTIVFMAYIIKKTEAYYLSINKLAFVACISLIGLGFIEYTFFRLAVTSAAPDTPAAMVGLMAFVYFLQKDRVGWILTLFSVTAVTMKLSLAPVLLLPLWHWIQSRNFRELALNTSLAIIIISPFLLKNVVNTGHLIFPFPETRVVSKEELPAERTVREEANYIKAYARTRTTSRSSEDINKIVSMPAKDWVPVWWGELSWGSRSMIIGFFVGLIVMITKRGISPKNNAELTTYLATCVLGFIFWILMAPAVRFGAAFLLAPIFYLTCHESEEINYSRKANHKTVITLRAAIISLIMILTSYLIYRMYYFMDISSLLVPKGPTL